MIFPSLFFVVVLFLQCISSEYHLLNLYVMLHINYRMFQVVLKLMVHYFTFYFRCLFRIKKCFSVVYDLSYMSKRIFLLFYFILFLIYLFKILFLLCIITVLFIEKNSNHFTNDLTKFRAEMIDNKNFKRNFIIYIFKVTS